MFRCKWANDIMTMRYSQTGFFLGERRWWYTGGFWGSLFSDDPSWTQTNNELLFFLVIFGMEPIFCSNLLTPCARKAQEFHPKNMSGFLPLALQRSIFISQQLPTQLWSTSAHLSMIHPLKPPLYVVRGSIGGWICRVTIDVTDMNHWTSVDDRCSGLGHVNHFHPEKRFMKNPNWSLMSREANPMRIIDPEFSLEAL